MSTEQAWVQHSSGATTLSRIRGADCYKTEFEKALLLSHIGQIVSCERQLYLDTRRRAH